MQKGWKEETKKVDRLKSAGAGLVFLLMAAVMPGKDKGRVQRLQQEVMRLRVKEQKG